MGVGGSREPRDSVGLGKEREEQWYWGAEAEPVGLAGGLNMASEFRGTPSLCRSSWTHGSVLPRWGSEENREWSRLQLCICRWPSQPWDWSERRARVRGQRPGAHGCLQSAEEGKSSSEGWPGGKGRETDMPEGGGAAGVVQPGQKVLRG